MKILINMPTIDQDGIMFLWLLKFKKLQDEGWDLYLHGGTFIDKIHIDDPYTFNKNFKPIKAKGISKTTKINFILYSIKSNFQAFKNYKKIVRQKYDIIYSPSSVLDLSLFPWFIKKMNKNTKWVVLLDNIVPFTDPGNKLIRFLAWFFFIISLGLLRSADVIFTISDDLKKFLVDRKFDSKKVVVTGNAIENDLVAKAKGIKKYETDALFIGRINETKGIYDMLKVLEIVKRKIPNFSLTILGKGDEKTENEFKKTIDQMELTNNVNFLGYVTGVEKFNIIKSSKCFWFLSVSKSESFGIALLESVCCGKHAFVYDLDPFKKIYKNNEVHMYPKNDYNAVANGVIDMFEKKDFENKMGKLLLNKYSWDKIATIESNAMKRVL